jgi:ankyrin repeat protein/mono/diheme cytochrome c family protein
MRTWLTAALFWIASALPAPAQVTVDYERQVKPILSSRCFGCHGPTQQQSGLRLDLRQNALRGGDYGPVIVPGKSAESKLILRLAGSTVGLQMPPAGPLPPEEIDLLRAWIDQGADMPGRANETVVEKPPTDPKVQAFLDAIHRHDLGAVRKTLVADRSFARSADAAGSTALMHAAYAGTIEIMTALLDAGADVNARNARKATALHWAAADPSKLKLLLARGAEINAKTVEGRTVLYLAALEPDGTAIVRLLVEVGAEVDARTITGTTPLFAAAGASLESLRLLLDKGADPNGKSDTGATALMTAALRSPAAVALLVSRGADVKARTKRGETALGNAAERGDLASVKLLLDKGADINVTDFRGYTPLMHAAYFDRVSADLIRLMLARGADIKATGEGETAVTLASKRGETDVTRVLQEAAATSASPAAGTRDNR